AGGGGGPGVGAARSPGGQGGGDRGDGPPGGRGRRAAGAGAGGGADTAGPGPGAVGRGRDREGALMLTAKVTGNVWSTRRLAEIPNGAFLEVEAEGTGQRFVAFARLGRGVGGGVQYRARLGRGA